MIQIAQNQEKTKFQTTPYGRPPPDPPPPPNFSGDLFGNREDDRKFCAIASTREVKIGKRPDLVGFGISENHDTALHIAADVNCSKSMEEFVKNLVSYLKTMVIKKMTFLRITEMVAYHYNLGWLLQKCVEADIFDASRKIPMAVEMGNTKFVVELIRHFPELIWKKNDEAETIFHVAVTHLREGIYNLLHEIGSMKDMITPLKDEEGNNMLHLGLQMQRELLWFKEVVIHNGAQQSTLCK